ncbi:hypothetical protein ACOSQ4_029078 [Xanthoceras sorbifolium]
MDYEEISRLCGSLRLSLEEGEISYNCGRDEGEGAFAFGSWLRASSPLKGRSSGFIQKEPTADPSRIRVVPPTHEVSIIEDLASNAHVVHDATVCSERVDGVMEKTTLNSTVKKTNTCKADYLRPAILLMFCLQFLQKVWLVIVRCLDCSLGTSSMQSLDVQQQLHGLHTGVLFSDEGLGPITGVGLETVRLGVKNKIGWKRKLRDCNKSIHSPMHTRNLGKRVAVDESDDQIKLLKKAKMFDKSNGMKHFCWNVRGLRCSRAFQILRLLKQDHDPDLMFLMETKINHCMAEFIRIKLGYIGKLVVDNVGTSGNLLLFWSDNETVDLLSFFCFHIDVQKSAHIPLLIEFDLCNSRSIIDHSPGRRRLHFEACWMNENGYQDIIKTAWDQLGPNVTLSNVASCLFQCSIKLRHFLASVVHRYFAKLFCSDSPSIACMEQVCVIVPTCLSTRSSSSYLDGAFTREEIRKALFDMGPTKALSLDGRLIFDNAIVSFECLHALKRKVGRVKGSFTLRLDMSKAYDRVEWPFLELIMLRLGFSLAWVDRIIRCVRGGPKITHLFFADDSLLFSEASVGDCQKSAICVNKQVSSEEGLCLSNILGVQLIPCHDRYLGLPSFPCSPPNLDVFALVHQLKLPSGGWDVDLIKSNFVQVDVDSILNIPPCSPLTDDVLIWHFDPHGRNKTIHGNHRFMFDDAMNWTSDYLQHYIVVNLPATVAPSLHIFAARWTAPAIDCWKINTDASVFTNRGRIGFGIVIRNFSGAVMASSAQQMEGCFSIAIAEALGVLRRLQFACDSGLLPAILETDSQVVVKAIASSESHLADLDLVATDIRALLSSFLGTVINFIARSANNSAHVLAAFAQTIVSDCFWMEDYPSCLCKPLQEDCLPVG